MFGKLFLKGDFGKSESPLFHYEIARALMDKTSRKPLAIVVSRGHAKTCLVKASILHDFLFNPKDAVPLFYAWVADNLSKARLNIDYISTQILYSKRIKYYFGNMAGKIWNADDLMFSNGCTLISRSNAKSLRGETKGSVLGGSQRFNRALLDDIENHDNTLTLQGRQERKKIVTNEILPALDVQTGRLIFIGTPVHPDSYCQNILDSYKKAQMEGDEDKFSYEVIFYKATQPTMPGGVLWNSYIPKTKLDEIKKQFADSGNLGGYYQEYELEPQGNENRIWTREHYKIHDAVYFWDEELKHGFLKWGEEAFPVNCFLGCDPATDIATRTSDKSVIMVIAEDAIKRIFVLEYVSKLAIPQLAMRDPQGKILDGQEEGVVDHIFELYNRYHCSWGTVEDVGMTRGVWQDIDAEKYRRNDFNILIEPEKPGGREKLNKIKTGLNSFFALRLIYLREDHWSLREQIENFGPELAHDDEIETLFFATRNIYPPNLNKNKDKWESTTVRPVKDWKVA